MSIKTLIPLIFSSRHGIWRHQRLWHVVPRGRCHVHPGWRLLLPTPFTDVLKKYDSEGKHLGLIYLKTRTFGWWKVSLRFRNHEFETICSNSWQNSLIIGVYSVASARWHISNFPTMSPPRKMISFRISKLPIITVIFPWLTDFHPFSLSGHWRTPGWSNNGRYNHTWSENRSWVACRGDERRTWWPTLDGESQERRRTSGSYRANRIGRDRRTELWQKQYCVNTPLEIQGSNVIFPLGAMHTQLCADSNQETRGCFSIKMPSYPYRNSRYKDNTVIRLSYLYNGNPIHGKVVFILKNAPDEGHRLILFAPSLLRLRDQCFF